MSKKSFDEIWNLIGINAGTSIITKSGISFQYTMKNNNYIITDRTNYILSKSDFKKAYGMMPIKGPGEISNIVRGPSYIWAILNTFN